MTQDYTNCFAYRETSCTALTKKICNKGSCPFYKPETGSMNRMKIENDIIVYSSTKNIYKTRNHQYYD